MLARMMRAGSPRIREDPAGGLAPAWALETAATEMVNVGIYLANRDGGQSYNQLADLMGVSKAAVIKRAKLGQQITRERERQHPATIRATDPLLTAARVAQPRELPPGADGQQQFPT